MDRIFIKYWFIAFLLLTWPCFSFSSDQGVIKGKIIDGLNSRPLSFVLVKFARNSAVLSDSSGVFAVPGNVSYVILSHPGYLQVKLNRDELKEEYQVIKMFPGNGFSLSSDSLSRAKHLKLVRFLAEGKIPIWYFNLNYNNFFNYNLYEGIRIGVGAETNSRLSKYFTVGGYITYGLKDQAVRWGEWVDIYPKGYHDFRLHWSYRDMNLEFGHPEFLEKTSLLNPEFFRNLLIKNMYSTKRYALGLELRPFRELNTYLFADLSDNSARRNNPFLALHAFDRFRLVRTGLLLRYSPGVSFIRDPELIIEKTAAKADLFLNLIRGLNLFEGEFSYTKLEFKGKYRFQLSEGKTTSALLRLGYISDQAPLTEIFNGYGSYVRTFSLVAPNAFNTMRQNEFAASGYSSLHLRQDFKLFRISALNPVLVLAQNIGFGYLGSANRVRYGMNDFHKGYFESGIEINNLLRMDFISWGTGIYYRYGPYQFPRTSENFAYKFGFYFNL